MHWASVVTPRGEKRSLQGWANRDQMLAAMDAADVNRAVLLGWYWEHHETCVCQNRWHAQWLREDPDRWLAFMAIQPLAGERALDEVKRAADAGCIGIGELFPQVQGFARDDPTWLRIVELAIERGLVIHWHVAEPVGPTYTGKRDTPLNDYLWLAQTYPELTLILAHWGGLLPFYELNPFCKKAFQNVFYDTAAGPLLYDKRIYQAVVSVVGAEKILFGSDYPLRVYKEKEPEFRRFVQEIQGSGLTDEACAAVLGGNAKRILL